jgi:hypothetical protein
MYLPWAADGARGARNGRDIPFSFLWGTVWSINLLISTGFSLMLDSSPAMEPESLEMAEVHAAALLDPDLLRLVQEIEAHRLYPRVIAAHVACVQVCCPFPEPRYATHTLASSRQRSKLIKKSEESFKAKPYAKVLPLEDNLNSYAFQKCFFIAFTGLINY